MAKRLKRDKVGAVLQALYDSEFHVRIEWLWDAGFDIALGLEESDIERTTMRRIEQAVSRLAEKAVAESPESVFAKRWNSGEFSNA